MCPSRPSKNRDYFWFARIDAVIVVSDSSLIRRILTSSFPHDVSIFTIQFPPFYSYSQLSSMFPSGLVYRKELIKRKFFLQNQVEPIFVYPLEGQVEWSQESQVVVISPNSETFHTCCTFHVVIHNAKEISKEEAKTIWDQTYQHSEQKSTLHFSILLDRKVTWWFAFLRSHQIRVDHFHFCEVFSPTIKLFGVRCSGKFSQR